MAKPLRIEYSEAVYHVTSRGNARNKRDTESAEICDKTDNSKYIQRKILDKQARNKQMYKAHIKHGYTLKEIANYLGVHYTTVSKVIKNGEGKK